ncbi:MAG: hypothetical protein JNG89_19355 [Planctomycetaceae bacterium]|nr:hypothetical protein [Planctomycetaceae bacterium]
MILATLLTAMIITGDAEPVSGVQLNAVESVFSDSEQLAGADRVLPVANGLDDHRDWSALDTLELFAGLEGSKQPQDFGVNAHFGARIHANCGVPISRELGLGLQIGTSLNATDHAVRVTQAVDGASSRNQNFSTVGIFQRTSSGWVWAIVHDMLYQDDYDRVFLSQWRARAGFQIGDFDQLGVYGMAPQQDDTAQWGPTNVRLRPLTQGSVYWRHTFEYGAQVTGWIGAAESHGQANIALGNDNPTGPRVVFGSDVHLPLSDHLAIFGEANFVTPAATGTVDAYLGFAYYPGGNARLWRNRAFSPVLPVANNTSFTTDLR